MLRHFHLANECQLLAATTEDEMEALLTVPGSRLTAVPLGGGFALLGTDVAGGIYAILAKRIPEPIASRCWTAWAT
jgi:hypothetical protein